MTYNVSKKYVGVLSSGWVPVPRVYMGKDIRNWSANKLLKGTDAIRENRSKFAHDRSTFIA